MRASTSRRTALLGVVAMAAATLGPNGAVADHSVLPNDDRQWIAQAGNGGGGSQPFDEPSGLPILEDMNVQSVLFHPRRFQLDNGVARPGFGRYVAFGLVRVQPPDLNEVVSQLAISHSEDGLRWSAPQPATIKDPAGVDVPFILNEPGGFFDVVFTPSPNGAQFPLAQFAILYRDYNEQAAAATDTSELHIAWSDEGQTWYSDQPIGESGEPVLAAGGFKAASHGPTDVIFQTDAQLHASVRPIAGSPSCATEDPDGEGPMVPSPWNCRVVMLYDAIGADGRHQIAIASAPDLGHPGGPPFSRPSPPSFTGQPAPLLAAGDAGAWDDRVATMGKVRIRPNPVDPRFRLYDLYYAGGQAPDDACFGNATGCWSFGTAISTGGLTWSKTVANPVTPRELLEVFGPDDPHTLWAPSIQDDASENGGGHARIYYTRITNGDGESFPQRDMFLAYTEPAPTQAPRIRISEPQAVDSPAFPIPFRNREDTPILVYIADTLGASDMIGVDLNTLAITVDGVPLEGWTPEEPHLVSALKVPAVRIAIPSGNTRLEDGLHTFGVEVADLEGNVATASRSFIVDTKPPSTTVLSGPEDMRIGFPLAGPGTFTGETVETSDGTAIGRLDVTVVNPLGMSATYEVRGSLIDVVSPKKWRWTWIAPTPDLHFALPGNYTFIFRAADVAQNREAPSDENTYTVLLL